MWRSYAKGERMICGIPLPDGLRQDTILPELLITPSTKGVLRGIAGVPEVDDVNVRRPRLCGGVLCGCVIGGGGCVHVCVCVCGALLSKAMHYHHRCRRRYHHLLQQGLPPTHPPTHRPPSHLTSLSQTSLSQVSRADIESHPDAFGFRSPDDIGEYERLLAEGFDVISAALAEHDLIFVDTKFEFGYAAGRDDVERLIYMDEVGNSTTLSLFLLLCSRKQAALRFYRAAASLLNAAPCRANDQTHALVARLIYASCISPSMGQPLLASSPPSPAPLHLSSSTPLPHRPHLATTYATTATTSHAQIYIYTNTPPRTRPGGHARLVTHLGWPSIPQRRSGGGEQQRDVSQAVVRECA
jgi:hypothetical protein